MSTDLAQTLALRLGYGRQLRYFPQFSCILLQIQLLAVTFSAAQLHTLICPLCLPRTSQTLERVKGSLRTKYCLPLRPEIQITQDAASPGVCSGWKQLGVAQRCCSGPPL